jgi:hypothetical protein
MLGGCGGRTSFDPVDLGIAPSPSPVGSTASSGGSGATSPVGSGGAGGIMATGGKPAAPAGGSASGGAPSAGKGGTAPIPGSPGVGVAGFTGTSGSAGAASGGSGGLDPAVVEACAGYCKSYVSSPCLDAPSTTTYCEQTCQEEFGPRSASCQKLGIEVLSCLGAVLDYVSDCTELVPLYDAKCGGPVTSYENCAAATPVPPPNPPGMPGCSSSESYGNGSCTMTSKCDSGAYYNVNCSQTSANQSSCSCTATFRNGSSTGAGFNLNEAVPFACEDTLAACAAPSPSPK